MIYFNTVETKDKVELAVVISILRSIKKLENYTFLLFSCCLNE